MGGDLGRDKIVGGDKEDVEEVFKDAGISPLKLSSMQL